MKNSEEMTFFEHLLELRTRMLVVFFSIFIFSILGYLNSDFIISFLISTIDNPDITFQVLKITSIFMTKITVSIFFGLMISFPILLSQILLFIRPALKNSLSIWSIIKFILLSLFLFCIGLIFGYFILIPFSISFFTQLSLPLIESVNLSFTLENYLIYLIWVLIISSIIYQLPIFVIFFIKMDLIDLDWLKNNRSYIVIVFFILSALFTPPDPLSQILVALPLILLFEITIILVKVLNKKHE